MFCAEASFSGLIRIQPPMGFWLKSIPFLIAVRWWFIERSSAHCCLRFCVCCGWLGLTWKRYFSTVGMVSPFIMDGFSFVSPSFIAYIYLESNNYCAWLRKHRLRGMPSVWFPLINISIYEKRIFFLPSKQPKFNVWSLWF